MLSRANMLSSTMEINHSVPCLSEQTVFFLFSATMGGKICLASSDITSEEKFFRPFSESAAGADESGRENEKKSSKRALFFIERLLYLLNDLGELVVGLHQIPVRAEFQNAPYIFHLA